MKRSRPRPGFSIPFLLHQNDQMGYINRTGWLLCKSKGGKPENAPIAVPQGNMSLISRDAYALSQITPEISEFWLKTRVHVPDLPATSRQRRATLSSGHGPRHSCCCYRPVGWPQVNRTTAQGAAPANRFRQPHDSPISILQDMFLSMQLTWQSIAVRGSSSGGFISSPNL